MNLMAKAANLNTSLKESAITFAVRAVNFRRSKSDCSEQNNWEYGKSDSRRNIFSTIQQSAILMDCIAVFLISSSINLLLLTLPHFYGSIDTMQAFGFIAISIIAYIILRLRWWLTPGLIALALTAFVFYHLYFGTLRERFIYLTEFAEWLFRYMPEHDIFSQSSESVLIARSVICLITLALLFVMRRFTSPLIPIAAFAAAAITAGTSQNFYVPLPLFAAGIIVLLPRTFAHQLNKRKKINFARSHVQLIAIPIAALTVFFGLIILPPSGTYYRFRPLANMFIDIGHLINPIPAENIRSFDIYSLGFGVSPDRLGGPVVLSDGYILTVVSSAPDVPILLSGSVMDYYTGYRWLPGENDSSLRFNSRLWRENRENAFDFSMPKGCPQVFAAFYAISEYVNLKITYATEFYTTVFSSSGLRGISFASPVLNDDIRFNERSELYMPTSIPVGEVLTVNTRVINRNSPLFFDTILLLEETVGVDPRYPAIRERYTVLPDSLPDIVRETALYVIGDETSPFKKATALAAWLGENFHYTLEPVIPPEDMDFVAHFLETREGYCTYYATAMAVMARTVGLPSRYVTGFALFRDPLQNDIFYATGRTAHAWAEIYFYGLGWIPFDPLDWNPDMPPHLPFAFGAHDWWAYWYWDDYMAWGGAIGARSGYYDEFANAYHLQQPGIGAANIAVRAAGILLAVALLIFIFLYYRKRRKYSLRRVLRKFPNPVDRFSFYFSDIMEKLRVMGLGISPGETLLNYDKRIAPQIATQGLSDSSLDAITQAQMRLHFAGILPSDTDVEIAGSFRAKLEEKRRSNKIKRPTSKN